MKYNLPPDVQTKMIEGLTEKIMLPARMADRANFLDWVMRYRRFDGIPPVLSPPLKAIYEDMSPNIVVLKAAQVGISEWGINMALYVADQKWGNRGVGLYVFPKQEQIDDFSQDRVTRAIQGSYYLKERVSQQDNANVNRTRLRRVAGSPIYFRGSDSVMQTRSIDADLVVCDEVDLFREGAIERVKQRLGSAESPLFRAFSQPLYPSGPIDMLWQESDQRHFYITCEHCPEEQFLDWDRNVEFTTDTLSCRVVCSRCKKPLDRLSEGRWIPHNPTSDIHGYHVSKLYAPRANLTEMLRQFLKVDDPEAMQSFYNADLGLPYKPAGTPGLTEFSRMVYPWGDPYLYESREEHGRYIPGWETYMGIDVGRKLHVTVVGRERRSDPLRLIFRESLDDFFPTGKGPSLEMRWSQFKPRLTVIDARGDPRATLEWSDKHPGKVYRWEHRPGAQEPGFHEDMVFYHRTSLLDNLYSVLKTHGCILHANAGAEFYGHLEANIRTILKDKDGRLVPRYVPTKEDHYAFALAFSLVAAGARPGTGAMSIIDKEGLEPAIVGVARPSWAGDTLSRGWSRWKMR